MNTATCPVCFCLYLSVFCYCYSFAPPSVFTISIIFKVCLCERPFFVITSLLMIRGHVKERLTHLELPIAIQGYSQRSVCKLPKLITSQDSQEFSVPTVDVCKLFWQKLSNILFNEKNIKYERSHLIRLSWSKHWSIYYQEEEKRHYSTIITTIWSLLNMVQIKIFFFSYCASLKSVWRHHNAPIKRYYTFRRGYTPLQLTALFIYAVLHCFHTHREREIRARHHTHASHLSATDTHTRTEQSLLDVGLLSNSARKKKLKSIKYTQVEHTWAVMHKDRERLGILWMPTVVYFCVCCSCWVYEICMREWRCTSGWRRREETKVTGR